MYNQSSRAIYLQIVDRIFDMILAGEYAEGGRVPSVREIAATLEVNANTAMRAYDTLTTLGVIHTERGKGFFVSPGARDKVISARRDELNRQVLPSIFRQLSLLSVTPADLADAFSTFLNNTNDTNITQ
ncbi:MAG: GntR family transcriptional regulator [Muribaculaceae bacterium]|nr:GntR family transcriptional regulator [Muribaculaceae bacterium]